MFNISVAKSGRLILFLQFLMDCLFLPFYFGGGHRCLIYSQFCEDIFILSLRKYTGCSKLEVLACEDG